MPKKQFKAEVTKEYTLVYDPEDAVFKDTLDGYKSSIDKRATEQSMLKQVIYHINNYGANGWLEGIGYLKIGKSTPCDPYSGIEIIDDEPDGDVEIISNDFI